MNRTSILYRLTALSLAALMGVVAYAQGYYDDDIYYDASKAKKETKKNAASSQQASSNNGAAQQYYYDGAQYVPWTNAGDFQAADTYQVTGTSTRDVDEYNRRTTASAQPAREVCDSITLEEFETMSNTRNLARFHDSQAAQQVYADDLGGYVDYGSAQNYGYQTPSTTVVNINVPSYPYYGYPYYGSSWYWNSWGYNPYYWGYDPYWGPSWSWGYPSWSWSWGWGGPGWGPSWGWNGPHYGWVHPRPNYTSASAFAPNMTHNSTGNYRPSSNYRGGSVAGNRSTAAGSLGTRPSATGGTVGRGTTGTVRPGYRAPTTNPTGVVSGSSGATRGRTVSSGSATVPNRTSTNSSTNYNTNRQPSTNSNYNYNNSSVTRGRSSSSSGSFSSGSSRGGFSGGGASRSGGGASGGGHRGR